MLKGGSEVSILIGLFVTASIEQDYCMNRDSFNVQDSTQQRRRVRVQIIVADILSSSCPTCQAQAQAM